MVTVLRVAWSVEAIVARGWSDRIGTVPSSVVEDYRSTASEPHRRPPTQAAPARETREHSAAITPPTEGSEPMATRRVCATV
jgi:hypothetical protein